MRQFPGPDAELSEQERFLRVSSEALSREFPPQQDSQAYTQDDIRDSWPSVVTAIILSGICLVLIGIGIAKFSQALKMTMQSTMLDVPESIKREALSYIR